MIEFVERFVFSAFDIFEDVQQVDFEVDEVKLNGNPLITGKGRVDVLCQFEQFFANGQIIFIVPLADKAESGRETQPIHQLLGVRQLRI
ncbi:MAG: hypothetical protein ACREX4_16710 [Gammaproteobacteria bacterium]